MTTYKVGYMQVETSGLDYKFHQITMLKLRTMEYDSQTNKIDKSSIQDIIFINKNPLIFHTTYQKKHICQLMGIATQTFDTLQDSTDKNLYVKEGNLHFTEHTLKHKENEYSLIELDYKVIETQLNTCNLLIMNYASFVLPFLRKNIKLKPMAMGCLVNDYLTVENGSVYKAFDKLVELEIGKTNLIQNTFDKFQMGCDILTTKFDKIIQLIKEDTCLIAIDTSIRDKNYFKDLDYNWEGTAFVKKVKKHQLIDEEKSLEELKKLKVSFTHSITSLAPNQRY